MHKTLLLSALTATAALAFAACGGNNTTPGPKSAPATLTVTGYGPHANQKLNFKVTELVDGGPAGSLKTSGMVPANGNLTLTISNAVGASGKYRFDWFVDMNGNDSYDAPPADHAWRKEANGNSSGATVTHQHDTNFTDIGPF